MSTKQIDFNAIYNDPKINKQYKATAEKLTGYYATALISQAGLLSSKGNEPLVVLDNACGSGIVSSLLYATLNESSKNHLKLTCGDVSEMFVKSVSERIQEEGWKGAEARIVDMQKMNLPDNHFTHILTNFAISLVPDPTAALNECFRTLRPNGILGLATGSTIGWYSDVSNALLTLPGPPPVPTATEFLRSSNGGDWHLESYISSQLTSHGFTDIQIESIPHKYSIGSVAEFVDDLAPMVNLVTGRFWDEGRREELGGLVLPGLKKYLKGKYGDEEIEMDWVGMVATGRKPGK
ncbi:MAG: hypothetical protein M1812_002947 [Candelaria pacifica]|nr:MAG: hypothetical protein M1812_002947 [Candelaria pacifica]